MPAQRNFALVHHVRITAAQIKGRTVGRSMKRTGNEADMENFTGSEKFYGNPQHLKRWIQDYTYKQYDVLVGPKSQKFYNFVLDPYEQHPISPAHMTPQQTAISQKFTSTMSQLH